MKRCLYKGVLYITGSEKETAASINEVSRALKMSNHEIRHFNGSMPVNYMESIPNDYFFVYSERFSDKTVIGIATTNYNKWLAEK